MTTNGSSETVKCCRLVFHKPVETIGWGGSRMRGSVDDKVCTIELDFALRIWRCTPLRGNAEPIEGPFENLTGWKRVSATAEKTPEPIDGEKEPTRAWKRKPASEKMQKPKRTAPVPAPDPAVPTATL